MGDAGNIARHVHHPPTGEQLLGSCLAAVGYLGAGSSSSGQGAEAPAGDMEVVV